MVRLDPEHGISESEDGNGLRCGVAHSIERVASDAPS
jgi:hypothetical protein